MARIKGYLGAKKRYQTGIRHRQVPTGVEEYLCQCPRCLTLESLLFRGNILVPTIRFHQGEDSIRLMPRAERLGVSSGGNILLPPERCSWIRPCSPLFFSILVKSSPALLSVEKSPWFSQENSADK